MNDFFESRGSNQNKEFRKEASPGGEGRVEHHLGGVGKLAGDLIEGDVVVKRIEKRIP
jgi:hypothetical protein